MGILTGKKILIVDDESEIRSMLCDFLRDCGLEVKEAENGKVAQRLLGEGRFDAVISDVRMPQMDGIQLLKELRGAGSRVPFFLMTGFSEISEGTDAIRLGATGFLAKPFRMEELLSLLEGVLEAAPAPEADLDDEYCRIRVEDFVTGSEIRHDIYIRMSCSKYFKIAHSGQDIDLERVKIFKAKNISFLYLKKEDFKRYVAFNLTLSGRVTASPGIDRLRKIRFLRQAGEMVLNGLYHDTLDPDVFQHSKAIVDTTLSVLGDSDEMLHLLEALNQHSDYLFAHSVGVAMYGSMIARQLGWTSPISLFKVTYAGLIHDIGKKEIPPEILMKPRLTRTADDIRLIESHPLRGLEILRMVPGISNEIIQVVYQHHENCAGTGYPGHLRKAKISAVARVIALADEFCKLVMKGPDGPGLQPDQALACIQTVSSDLFDPEIYEALVKVFGAKSGMGKPGARAA